MNLVDLFNQSPLRGGALLKIVSVRCAPKPRVRTQVLSVQSQTDYSRFLRSAFATFNNRRSKSDFGIGYMSSEKKV